MPLCPSSMLCPAYHCESTKIPVWLIDRYDHQAQVSDTRNHHRGIEHQGRQTRRNIMDLNPSQVKYRYIVSVDQLFGIELLQSQLLHPVIWLSCSKETARQKNPTRLSILLELTIVKLLQSQLLHHVLWLTWLEGLTPT